MVPAYKKEFVIDSKLNMPFGAMLLTPDAELDDIPFTFPHKVIEKRMEAANMGGDRKVILFIVFLAEGNPGKSMLILQSLSAYMKETGCECDLTGLGLMFADGFPSSESLEKMWDEQKVAGGNAVDQMVPEVWPTMG